MAKMAPSDALFELRVAALGIDVDEEDRKRLWESYQKQCELSGDWAGRVIPTAWPDIQFGTRADHDD